MRTRGYRIHWYKDSVDEADRESKEEKTNEIWCRGCDQRVYGWWVTERDGEDGSRGSTMTTSKGKSLKKNEEKKKKNNKRRMTNRRVAALARILNLLFMVKAFL